MGKIDPISGTKSFTITYGGLESPMSGIDATHQSGLYLDPTSLAAAGGVMSQDGYLNSIFLNPRASLILNEPDRAYTIGDVQVDTVTQGTQPYVTKASYGFVVVSYSSGLYIYEYRLGFTQSPPQIISYSGANLASNLTWYCINGIVYITGLGLGAIYAYTPSSGVSSLGVLTNYVGGVYLGELNGRLLVLCCDQIVGGVYSYYPFRVSWSAAQGAYSQFNPLVGGLATGAGYNDLPDVADEITGFFTTGPTGYIIRKQGITEMSPLNSGTEPFDFNHLWASQKGMGSVYPNTVSQYGSLGGFVADTGVITLGYGGVNEIQGVFWAEINRLIDELFAYGDPFNVDLAAPTSGLIPLYINNERKLAFILYIPTSDGLLFVGDVETKMWNEVSCWTQNQGQSTNIFAVSNKAFVGQGADQTIGCVSAIFGPSQTQLVLFTIDDTLQIPSLINPPPFLDSSPFAIFPIEEVSNFKDITVDAITIVGDADTVGTGAVIVTPNITSGSGDVSPLAYTPVSFNGQAQFKVSYPQQLPNASGTGIFTGKFPQLSLNMLMDNTNPSAVRIYKVVMYCSYDPQQRP